MVAKKKNCNPAKSYNCGNGCIKATFVCRKDGLKGQTVDITNRLTDLITQAGGATAPIQAKPQPEPKEEAKATPKPEPAAAPSGSMAEIFNTESPKRIKDNKKKGSRRRSGRSQSSPPIKIDTDGNPPVIAQDDKHRASVRKKMVKKYFNGDEALAKAFEAEINSQIEGLTPQMRTKKPHYEAIKAGDGKVKNSRELNSRDPDYNNLRAVAEQDNMAFSGSDSDAPKYGYLIAGEMIQSYGDTVLKAKNMSRDRYTITLGDSLDQNMFTSRHGDFKVESTSTDILDEYIENGKLTKSLQEMTNDQFFDYVEIQMYGDVSLDEFDAEFI